MKEVRLNLSDKIPYSTLFTLPEGDKIDKSDEGDLKLEDIIKDQRIYLISEKVKNEENTQKNIPIEGTKEIGAKGKLKIYEYPSAKLSDIEEASAISLLVVGQTGSGKTTLLNAFINALMDIKINDDFRYEIIHENMNHSQAFSMTDSINIYKYKTNRKFTCNKNY